MSRSLCILLLSLSSAVHAAIPTLTERSPFRPGLWWNPDTAGSGVEIHRSEEGAFLIWYTYRADGSPVWYTAQGPVTDGAFDAVLLEHRWSNDAYAGYHVVGSVELAIAHAEQVLMRWQFDNDAGGGERQLEPFRLSGTIADVDHSGAWHQRERTGYGLTLSEQGNFLFAALYYYDHQGLPAWVAGDNGGSGLAIGLNGFRGACPGCAYHPSTGQPAGTLRLDLLDESNIEVDVTVVASAGGWTLESERLEILTLPDSRRRADRMLVRMETEEALGRYLRLGLLSINASARNVLSGIEFSPAPPSPDASASISSTNVQEAGVDEATLLVSDGEVVFAQTGPGQIRRARIDTADGSIEALPDMQLALDPSLHDPEAVGMMLSGDRLLVVHGSRMSGYPINFIWSNPWMWIEGKLQVHIFDVGGEGAPQSLWSAVLDGHLLSARRVGDQVLLLHRHTPHVAGLQYSGNDQARFQQNVDLLRDTPLVDMLPGIAIEGGGPIPLLDPASVLLPPDTSRPMQPDMMLLTRIDLDDPERRESLGVIGYLDATYVSTQAIYLASSRYHHIQDPVLGVYRSGFTTSDLHKIALTDGVLDYRASGAVEGFLDANPDRASFRMGEHEGRLHVLSESWDGMWAPMGRHRLTILEESDRAQGLLRTVSVLPNSARPEAIGKPGETLYGTRFVGDRLYAVTFLTIDPLYVIDLSDPTDPRIAGEVDLPGFSDYLHPLPGGLLLGFGHDAIEVTTPSGFPFAWFQGLKLSLFDVSDPAQPRVLQELAFGRRGSESATLRHHHGFSILQGNDSRPTRFAIPMALHGADMPPVPGAPPSQSYPWTLSGLFRFEIDGQGANARIIELGPLVTRRATLGHTSGWQDGGRYNGRSLLFDAGSLYLDGNHFWGADWSAPANTRGPH
ncbi:MAG TPA: beta-propeller domain-containing protein [Xanthomonadaceae bacterium]|nr:beta-propeller domain-containing protein [Xanthomonadaceae bacterium]